jgi:hypothetical protein
MTNGVILHFLFIIEGNLDIFRLFSSFLFRIMMYKNIGTVVADSKTKTRSKLKFQAFFTK